MKAKKNQATKKTGTDTQTTKLAEDLAHKDQTILSLEKELLACQSYKEILNQQLLGYQQQPLYTVLEFYQNQWHNYYINAIALPLNQQYEQLIATALTLIAETQNLVQNKVQATHQFISLVQQQGLAYLQQGKDLQVKFTLLLKEQQEKLIETSCTRVTLLRDIVLSLIQNILQKLNSFSPKLTSSTFWSDQAKTG